MILVSKFMVHRALSDKTYLSLGLLSPLSFTTTVQFQLQCESLKIDLVALYFCFFNVQRRTVTSGDN